MTTQILLQNAGFEDLEQTTGSIEVAGSFHFSTLFRKSMGKSPHKLLIHKRVDYAEHLLRTTDLSITDIALNSGFCDQSHLS